jgi:hypothetical protein
LIVKLDAFGGFTAKSIQFSEFHPLLSRGVLPRERRGLGDEWGLFTVCVSQALRFRTKERTNFEKALLKPVEVFFVYLPGGRHDRKQA